ncbi:hypothetical protein AAHE18_09G085200 [Arachis hypogaea]
MDKNIFLVKYFYSHPQHYRTDDLKSHLLSKQLQQIFPQEDTGNTLYRPLIVLGSCFFRTIYMWYVKETEVQNSKQINGNHLLPGICESDRIFACSTGKG